MESTASVLAANLADSGLSSTYPTATALDRIRDRIRYVVDKLHDRGELRAPYSGHDSRHYQAVKLYNETRDIFPQCQKRLGTLTYKSRKRTFAHVAKKSESGMSLKTARC